MILLGRFARTWEAQLSFLPPYERNDPTPQYGLIQTCRQPQIGHA